MTINGNNYISADLTLVGYLASDLRKPAYLKNNDSRDVLSFSIAINEGYKKDGEFIQTGTTWYNYEAAAAGADMLRDLGIGKGDKVRIDGARQAVREYEDKDGNARLGITLTFGDVTVLEYADRDEDDEAPF